MMKTLTVKKLCPDVLQAESLSGLLDKEGVEFHAIDEVNWESYPYRPSVCFRIAHTEDAILLNYRVEEDSVRAKYGEDNGSVWTDACVEFFVIPADDGIYYNIESNCIGTVLVGAGKQRAERERAGADITGKIQRWSSLGRLPFEERGHACWELSLIVPYSVFFKSQVETLDGKVLRGNFYKCGDELKTPHFISWNPITAPQPDFHRPDAFGQLIFE